MAKKGNSEAATSLVAIYLIMYNIACCAGWLMILLLVSIHLYKFRLSNIQRIYDDVEDLLKIVQSAAVLEILHSAVGIVKSPWSTTFSQVFTRVWVVWAVLDITPDAQKSVFCILTILSWSLVEIPRYLFYVLNLLQAVPYPLFWLRYSLFAVLYPTGITGELGCMYHAFLYLKNKNLYEWVPMPEFPGFKISLLNALIFVTLLYIPGAPKMYMHMVNTRRKQFKLLDNPKKKE